MDVCQHLPEYLQVAHSALPQSPYLVEVVWIRPCFAQVLYEDHDCVCLSSLFQEIMVQDRIRDCPKDGSVRFVSRQANHL